MPSTLSMSADAEFEHMMREDPLFAAHKRAQEHNSGNDLLSLDACWRSGFALLERARRHRFPGERRVTLFPHRVVSS